MSLLYDVPFREISLVQNNDRDYVFSWEDLNSPVAAIFSELPYGEEENPNTFYPGRQGLSQRTLYDFPDGTEFTFYTEDDDVDITKTGEYNDETKEVVISFYAEDTAGIESNKRVYYKMDALFPEVEGRRPNYTILNGYLVIFVHGRSQ